MIALMCNWVLSELSHDLLYKLYRGGRELSTMRAVVSAPHGISLVVSCRTDYVHWCMEARTGLKREICSDTTLNPRSLNFSLHGHSVLGHTVKKNTVPSWSHKFLSTKMDRFFLEYTLKRTALKRPYTDNQLSNGAHSIQVRRFLLSACDKK